MNYINFEQDGGFPLATDILSFMQNNQNFLSEIAEGFGELTDIGDAVAVHGCVDNGTTITPGLIYLKKTDGTKELLPFLKNPVLTAGATYYTITGTSEQREFYNGECKDVLYERWCEISPVATDYLVANIQKPKTVSQLTNELNTTNNNLTTVGSVAENGSVPIGTIVMWTGFDGRDIPENWYPCTGGTLEGRQIPDMRGLFPIGWNPADAGKSPNSELSSYAVKPEGGKGGGAEFVWLNSAQSGLRDHNHYMSRATDGKVEDVAGDYVYDSSIGHYGDTYQTTEFHTSYVRNPASGNMNATEGHENRPPFVVVMFIIKVA